jgi:hypothetical protein
MILGLTSTFGRAQSSDTRYVFVDADCKQGFELLPDARRKRIITSITERDFKESIELLEAQEEIKGDFLAAIKEKYPASINQFKGIYVYMYMTREEAEAKKAELKDLYKRRGYKLIDFELK